ncbi:helix-turn-helix transcriptional regulator [Rhodoplanes sp. TEM]|uniref:Helix-turn-helix transcriptional regulator n=1 Tax=Rhodoplanes tepidamans TaxID=200616 RepID=A0ABT5J8C5_RHOTP|nr:MULTISPECIES: helix-turn-helix transcriptional regulator [Rhodoplanes]MDC7785646.1 helix-turn-helix transcriptional regulator [Rhodoplanes tepidamans]MDC7983287.1 helix-turn-helix transcriptional regulator [Rhodoplanes sp. TEM]MDQ0354787.1 DNA-binding CsgD family transcriptional regulator [Rhodoplanes tepidamans]
MMDNLATCSTHSELDRALTAFELPFAGQSVRAVVLDRAGTILATNAAWRDFAETSGLALANSGKGQNYLKYCAFADEQSGRIIDGITQLLNGRVDCLSFIYPCHTPTAQNWFLMLGFPFTQGEARAVLLHIDISRLMPAASPDRPRPVVLKDDFGVEPFNARLERMMETIERSMRTVAPASDAAEAADSLPCTIDPKTGGPAVALSRRQRQVLELMAKGLSNIEIGRMLAISPNTVKIHVSGILARLGVPNRAQAIHWTLTRPHDEMRRQP